MTLSVTHACTRQLRAWLYGPGPHQFDGNMLRPSHAALLADGEAAYCCRLAACRALNLPGDVACAKAPLPQEYVANGGMDEASLQSYEEAETHGTAGFCGFIALKVARYCERIEAHPACADLYDRVIDVCERVEADCDGDPMPEEEKESELMTPSDLLALNDDWELTNPRALLRALRLDEETHKQAMRGLRLPACLLYTSPSPRDRG